MIQVNTKGILSVVAQCVPGYYSRTGQLLSVLAKGSIPQNQTAQIFSALRYIIAAVPEWNQKDTYNLYLSNTLAMENVKTTQMLDLYEDESPVYHPDTGRCDGGR
nr:VPS10 domain-containing receptor SorCS3-like [Oncorhynchus nerka]